MAVFFFAADIMRVLFGSRAPIPEHCSPVTPTGRLRVCKNLAKSDTVNSQEPYNLLTSNTRSSREDLKPQPCQSFVCDFSRKDLTLAE